MDIPIRPSKEMDTCGDECVLRERKLIRMPREFRLETEYEIGDSVYARTREGRTIALVVQPAYSSDREADCMSAYVATEIYDLIVGEGHTTSDVEPVSGITLGCDPEVILVDRDGTVIPASKFLRKYDPVGYDGLLLELRPLPSLSENTVALNMLKLLEVMRTKVTNKNLKVIATSSYHAAAQVTPKHRHMTKLTTGFHLHFGLPKPLLGYPRRFIADQIVKTLDYYVGIPALIPEGSSDSYRRTAPYLEYGKPGNYRIDDKTLEYRVPGGANMRHPSLAKGLIGLGAAVIEDIVARIKHHSEDFEKLAQIGNDRAIRLLYPNLPPAMEIYSTICNPYIDRARSHLAKIKSDIEKMVSFPARAGSIVEFFDSLEKEYSPDVELNWWRYYGKGQSGKVDVLQTSIQAGN